MPTELIDDPQLAPYRRGVARLWDGDELAGQLSTRVEVCRHTCGYRWWRIDSHPHEQLHWLFSHDPGWSRRHRDGWTEGAMSHALGMVVKEWNGGSFRFRGVTLRAEWLTGAEAEEELTRQS